MSAPGSPEWEKERADRAQAAHVWLRENTQLALVIPFAVMKDLLPGGMDNEKFQPILSDIMPGEICEELEYSQNRIYCHLKRS